MPSPGTKETILYLLGMAAGGFGKGAMMAEMAQDEGRQKEKERQYSLEEAKLKRKEALEDKAIDMLGAVWEDQTLPYKQRKKAGTSLSQFYSNLGGEAPAQFSEPYEMTSAERAQGMMQDPVTFRHGMTQMLKRDEVDPNADLVRKKMEMQITEIGSKIRKNNEYVDYLNRRQNINQQDKQWLTATKHRIDANIKRLEGYRNVNRMGRKEAGYDPKYSHIWQPILEDIQRDLDATKAYYAEQTGEVDWEQFLLRTE